MDEQSKGVTYLTSLLNKTLHVQTNDGRTFVGTFKCTDKVRIPPSPIPPSPPDLHTHHPPPLRTPYLLNTDPQDSNIILSTTHEYRAPSRAAVRAAAAAEAETGGAAESVKLDMVSRFVGLVVVPGRYVTGVKVEERRF
jgi:N-alpha-acetyltransferase 38, NatC auxiliary subunit